MNSRFHTLFIMIFLIDYLWQEVVRRFSFQWLHTKPWSMTWISNWTKHAFFLTWPTIWHSSRSLFFFLIWPNDNSFNRFSYIIFYHYFLSSWKIDDWSINFQWSMKRNCYSYKIIDAWNSRIILHPLSLRYCLQFLVCLCQEACKG